jgi:hypothetical protein
MKDEAHALRLHPASCPAGAYSGPVFERGRAGLHLAGAALELGHPRLGGAGILRVIEAGDEVVRQPGALATTTAIYGHLQAEDVRTAVNSIAPPSKTAPRVTGEL